MFSQGYIIDSQICLAVLYLFYILIIKERIAHRWARIYLLASVPIAMIIPLLSIPLLPAPAALQEIVYEQQFIEQSTEIEPIETVTHTVNYFLLTYVAGAILMMLWMSIGAIRLFYIINRSRVERIEGLRIIFAAQKVTAYSVFNYIFINQAIRNSDMLEELLAHEKAHIKLHHTLDLLFVCLIRSILWFNPIVWHTSMLLRKVHEYQADEKVIEYGYSIKRYVNLLILSEAGITPEFASTLSYSLTKNRIRMLAAKEKRVNFKRLSLVIPVVIMLLSVFSLTTRAAQESPIIIADSTFRLMQSESNSEIESTKDTIVFSDIKTKTFDNTSDIAGRRIVMSDMIEIKSYNNTSGIANLRVVTSEINTKSYNNTSDIAGRKIVMSDIKTRSMSPTSDIAVKLYGDDNVGSDGIIVVSTDKREKTQEIEIIPFGSYDENTTILVDGEKFNNSNITPSKVKYISVRTYSKEIVNTKELVKKKIINIHTNYLETTDKVTDNDMPVQKADVMPLFRGGSSKFQQWMSSQIVYPQKALDNKEQGRVMVQFIVEKDGTVSNPKILRSVSEDIDKEVLRVIMLSKWIPGRIKGKSVRVSYIVPVEFGLNFKELNEK